MELQAALAQLRPATAPSSPSPATAATATATATPAPVLPPLPESPDEIELTPLQCEDAYLLAKKEKLGQLHREFRIWEQLNCDLVEDAEGFWGYQLRPNSTTEPPLKPDGAEAVELTYEERTRALQAMQARLWGRLKSIHYHVEQEKAKLEEQARTASAYTAEYLWYWGQRAAQHQAQQRRPAFNFRLDADNQLVFELLCYYFAGDQRFVTVGLRELDQDLSLDKGLGLIGDVGVGKTVLMEAFRTNPLRPFGLVPSRKVSDVFREDAIGDGKVSHVSQAQSLYLGAGGRALCFDDVARESTKVQYMGNLVHPMQAVILSRADKFRIGRLNGWDTHFTSNNPLVRQEDQPLDMPSLSELYGAPAVDRLYELCNILTLKGESRRG